MIRKILFLIAFLPLCLFSQNDDNSILSGVISKQQMMQSPYDKWFNPEYEKYEPNQEIVNELKKIDLKKIKISIFLGTWCGDSQREVPRFIKVLEQLGFDNKNLEIIGLRTGEGVHKQSPTGEEKGKYIFRVPTFIIYKENEEVNRIVEFPVESLERDLFNIIKGGSEKYTPNYRSLSQIVKWLQSGVLLDKNVSFRGLAEQIRFLAMGPGEVVGTAYGLFHQGKKTEASVLCKIAAYLFPDNVNYYICAQILSESGEDNDALNMINTYFAKKTSNPKDTERMLELYNRIKTKNTK